MDNTRTDELLALLSAAAAKDEEAFRRLYDATHKSIYFFVHRILKDRQMAEDVVMETYLAVWKGAGNFKGQSKVLTWIFGIARNLALNALKKKRQDYPLDDFHHLATDGGMDSSGSDRREVIAKALLQVSVKHREVLDLVFYQGFNYEEIASILKVHVNTIKTRVFYAKKALHDTLNTMGVNRDDL
jgi:RNA polymerase sigma-70 factor (ECF subfamily)